MKWVNADAEIYRVAPQGGGSSKPSLLPGFFDTYHQVQSSERHPAEEPPRKRARIEKGPVELFQIVEGDPGFVLLAGISLSLKLSKTSRTPSDTGSHGPDSPVPVKIEYFGRLGTQSCELCLVGSASDAGKVELRLRHLSTNLLTHLECLNLASHSQASSREKQLAISQCYLSPPSSTRSQYLFEGKLYWKIGTPIPLVSGRKNETLDSIFAKYIPVPLDASATWTLEDFFSAVHIPSTDAEPPSQIQHESLKSNLYPFQKRAVEWLLRREGVTFQKNALAPLDSVVTLPEGFIETKDAKLRTCYVHPGKGIVVTDTQTFPRHTQALRGGILAEEMGLGKTVELINLICTHKRRMGDAQMFDDQSGTTVTPSAATLIITPNSILHQWESELEKHAPHLKVLHYKGMPHVAKPNDADLASPEYLSKHDVVLTTYNTLAREIHHANKPADRQLRHEKVHVVRRSPLVQLNWWRVCLDEAQMIQSGVSQAATVARLIPRCNAWAVSGTPLKKDIQDLLGLLIFLRYEPYASSKMAWNTMDKMTFRDLFSRIAMRHTKDKIRHELRIPLQKRIVITVPFTAIEEQVYSQIIDEMCRACDMSREGAPLSDDWVPNHERMRHWLNRLRQICLHPEVGKRNRRALGRSGDAAPLRTVGEVLEVMIEHNETNIRGEERRLVMTQITRGHIYAYANDLPDRATFSLHIYQEALKQATRLVEEAKSDLAAERTRETNGSDTAKPEQAIAASPDNSNATDEDDGGSEKKTDASGKLVALRKTLRSVLEVQHACMFFIATAYFQIKSTISPDDKAALEQAEALETEWYDKAKSVRQLMLRESHSRAARSMRNIEGKTKSRRLNHVPDIPVLTDFGGIENRKAIEKLDLIGDALDDQATQIDGWRRKIITILLQPLVDEDKGESTGDEYEDSTKAQDELYVYLLALRAIVAERNAILTGQTNFLMQTELNSAVKFAKEGQGHAPQLLLQLEDKIPSSLNSKEHSLRSVIADLRGIATLLQWEAQSGSSRANVELTVVEKHLREVQTTLSNQTKAIANLEKELDLFHNTMNLRLEFYKQLQIISDTVKPYKEDMDEHLDQHALAIYNQHEVQGKNKLATLLTKNRFLKHLRSDSNADGNRICVICQCDFENGVLTVCGHQYCKECIREWWSAHRTCPVCKRRLYTTDFHDITYKPREVRAQEETSEQTSPSKLGGSPESSSSAAPSPGSNGRQTSLYADISTSTLDAIHSVDLPSNHSYGTKIDTIARHLLYIRDADPGSKSLIFSQYSDFLSVVAGALDKFKIGHASMTKGTVGIDKFKDDPGTEVFLLDAKSDASGLNLINATYVFLCEPLINPALELQAVARVHRIGQKRATTVFMYIVSDTVEETIYDISVARRLEHIGRRSDKDNLRTTTPGLLKEKDIEQANSLEMQQAPLSKLVVKEKGGGEVVSEQDLWKCLFGRPAKGVGISEGLRSEVDRHLRIEAAEARRDGSAAETT
ncbi:hypothetical protein K402DRAFT_465092 [Aulographum hederae CBS 113979]|uniref:ATP-dependent DNA helicase n=1 Tax=Aulographum hederae CBS 113979 TaxID=1176131 RepID=A0A6G1GUY1_9PEZI|nr:hypothetical protein K402DRAFT_465092 [Aulographum hederae CBS 113979]